MKYCKVIALMLSAALCFVLALPAMAADSTPLDFCLTISYTYTDENDVEHVLEGVEFHLYQVAALQDDYTLVNVEPFEDFDIPDGLFYDQTLLIETCDSLEHYIDSNAFDTYKTVTTNGIGAVTVTLDSGLYYIDAQLFWDDEETGETASAYYTTPFLVLIGAYDEENDTYIYTYDAMPKISMMSLTLDEGTYTYSMTVRKEWENTDYTTLPTEIEVQLYCDGSCGDDDHDEIVTLNAANDWSYTWDGLDANHTWAVVEVTSLANYDTSYNLTIDEDTGQYVTVITNTYTGDPDPDPTATPTATPTTTTTTSTTPPPPPPAGDETLPQTGSNLPYVPVFAGIGLALIAAGILLKKGGNRPCE